MTLRELARVRPSSLERMRSVTGIGDAKLRAFGQTFFDAIEDHCRRHGLARDQGPGAVRAAEPRPPSGGRANPQREQAFELFRRGASLDDVARQTGRAPSTAAEYLEQFVRAERPRSLAPWVPDEVYARIRTAAQHFGTESLRAIFVALGEQVPYEQIRAVLAHLQT